LNIEEILKIKTSELLKHSAYDPAQFLDRLINMLRVKNDAALGRVLDFPPPVISKIRHRVLPIGSSFLISVMEETGMKSREVKPMMFQQVH
jgi:hypothetical protein